MLFNNKIQAIKAVREAGKVSAPQAAKLLSEIAEGQGTGTIVSITLKDAKDLTEAIMEFGFCYHTAENQRKKEEAIASGKLTMRANPPVPAFEDIRQTRLSQHDREIERLQQLVGDLDAQLAVLKSEGRYDRDRIQDLEHRVYQR
jgi:hypothetical protein